MTSVRLKRLLGALVAGVVLLGACATTSTEHSIQQSDHFREGRFINTEPFPDPSFSETLNIFTRFMFEKRVNGVPKHELPVIRSTPRDMAARLSVDTAVYRLGHSSLLLELSGDVWLTDPIFSERASPVQWMGPKRFHPVPVDPDQLPPIKGIIISHDHYDHLDKGTIQRLHANVEGFYVPLGVGEYLLDWGVPADKVHEFDWWQEQQIGSVKLVSTPANHFSGRGLLDRNRTLWSSWVIQTEQHSLFFSGDSGYFNGFKTIGEKYGPFDLTLMENGAYDDLWKYVHMQPKESLQAHIDLGGKVMLPIHNGTFELAFHSWTDPFEQLSKLAEAAGQTVATPIMGQRWQLNQPIPQLSWWRLKDQQVAKASDLSPEEHLLIVD